MSRTTHKQANQAHIEKLANPFKPAIPKQAGKTVHYGNLHGSSFSAIISAASRFHQGLMVLVTEDMASALRLESELRFFLSNHPSCPTLAFPDWETLPYDVFSPHQEIISQRIETLYHLPKTSKGILILPVATLMQRIAPRDYLMQHSVILNTGQQIDLAAMRSQLEKNGYQCVPQVFGPGEFAVRGALLDLYPSGSPHPIRLELLDDEIDNIRTFDAETQLTIEKVDQIRLIPAKEFPFTEQAISVFRQAFRDTFEGNPQQCQIYKDVSNSIIPNGIEYYLPLFFEKTASLFEYLPDDALVFCTENVMTAANDFWQDLTERYDQRRHNIERPLLPPEQLFIDTASLTKHLSQYPQIILKQSVCDIEENQQINECINFATQTPPLLLLNSRIEESAKELVEFIQSFDGRVLFAAETEGRREMILEILHPHGIHPKVLDSWQAFYQNSDPCAITIAPIENGLLLTSPAIAIISEPQLFGQRAQQRRRRHHAERDPSTIIGNLTDLHIGAPVVHQDHGVGRYLGLQKLDINNLETEFLTLEYANEAKLYVPVASLHLISRYTGASPENAPLHRLGSDQWQKARHKATEKAYDVAAELLDIYARREASQGQAFQANPEEYQTFVANFPFEETPDQETTIHKVIEDLQRSQPMDRVVCGDVGFGKTEVAMRAAFVAVTNHTQVAVLVPTTLLAQQHYNNFLDRFADWPVKIELLSRFRSKKQQDETLKELKSGNVDIVIGTHKLIQDSIKFKNLGLVIIDEEHRFGVRQKERIKSFCSHINLLTLTATPIPRTLNMSLSGLRDLSIIATPPEGRLAVQTFVSEWQNATIKEACQREIKRGGQVYFLHNDVESIARICRELSELVPEASIEFAHGQMRETELEQVMLDFYHRRFNLLVCTTIIESGIDVPSANTIIINRADKLGLAQLHQLRGRVGRSHHRAYAYLVVPPRRAMTIDAVKRIEAIQSLEDLGAGFMLATHDLEIRGAGELLGEGQSGQIHEVGFTLYNELLERAVKALKSGKQPQLDRPLDHGTEIELGIPALLPDDYLPDVHHRLIMYKRIANSQTNTELKELQVEMIDRFGLLPKPAKNLIQITELKIKADPLGITKIEANASSCRIIFDEEPKVDPLIVIQLVQQQPNIYRFDGQNKLRVVKAFTETEERIKFIDQLLDILGNTK